MKWLKTLELTDWSLLRVLRLVIGGSLLGEFITGNNWFLLPVAVLFLYQGVFNTGCSACEQGSCEIK